MNCVIYVQEKGLQNNDSRQSCKYFGRIFDEREMCLLMLTLNAALRFFSKNISNWEVKKRRLLLPGGVELIREETKLEELRLKNGLQRRGTFRMLMQKICDSETASGGGVVDVVLVDLGSNK